MAYYKFLLFSIDIWEISFLFIFYHVLNFSSFPFVFGLRLYFFVSSFLVFLKLGNWLNLFFSFIYIFFLFLGWGGRVNLEEGAGYHNFLVVEGLKFGFVLFLIREVMFFFSIFWIFFDSSWVYFLEVGWSPLGVFLVNPLGLPFFNTILLLRRAIFLTWSHNSLIGKKNGVFGLFWTIILGLNFLLVQIREYYLMFFNFSDRIFGSVFFLLTGFHGFHVILGIIFLVINFFLILKNQKNFLSHISYEISILYWHFVDVIWLFLFYFSYWWVY